MINRNARFFSPAFSLLAVAVVLPLAKPAAADVKIVSKVTGPSGRLPGRGEAGQAANQAETVTTYYKGNKIRIERPGNVLVIDGDGGKVYQIDPARKTYSVRPLAPPANMSPMMGMIDFKTTADIKPNGKTRVIAGKPTTGYTYHATITMGMKPGAMGKMGKAGAPPPPPNGMPSMGGMTITGEEWITQSVALPVKANGLGAAAQMGNIGQQMPGLKPMMDKLSSVKGLPLSTVQTITGTGMLAGVMGGGRPPMGGGAPPRGGGGIRVTSEAVSISEAPLPATLFGVPSGYKQESLPAPGMGRGPGGGPRPGMMMPPPPPGGGRP